ncbi:hypothetical protein AAFP30_14445 [Gordonia sp. CPCC 205515]|uniref:LGFP repeat-containing protein n=1 Tax=Gordonia sp. CPCC 205515 TaxID=3140791 RepID=UPI003AF334B8
MKQTVRRLAGVVAAASLITLGVAACSDDDTNDATSAATSAASAAMSAAEGAGSAAQSAAADASSAAGSAMSGAQSAMSSAMAGAPVMLTAADGTPVTLTGPIAAKYASATDQQKTDLGKPLAGAGTGTSPNGVVFQQFDGGVITAKNADASTPAYITWGKIRDAWNVPRNAEGVPASDGKGGSEGPLGAATSDETQDGDMKTSTFENGKITYNTSTDTVEVTVNGKVVPTS